MTIISLSLTRLLLDRSLGAHDDGAAACRVGLSNAALAVDESPRRKVGTGYQLDDLFKAGVGIIRPAGSRRQ